jgi:hypothetical protein
MRHIWIIIAIAVLASCEKTEDEKAAPLMQCIEQLYSEGKYHEVLDSIVSLRDKHPRAVESRKRALAIWQEASLKNAQEDIAKTDSALQTTLEQIERTSDLYTANMLRAKRDSLKARYEAMCGVVRIIHVKQNEGKDSVNINKE